MSDLKIGDEVFGMDGAIYRITGTSDVMYGHRVFDVVFDDGTIIRADADHQWHTFTYAERMALHRRGDEYRERRRRQRKSRGIGKRLDLAELNRQRATVYVPEQVTGGVRSTLDIKATLSIKGRINHAIPIAAPLQLPAQDLPIDPYILGFWLGDGNSHYGRVTIGDEYAAESCNLIEQAGYKITPIRSSKYQYTIRGLQPQIKALGVYKNKHIPEMYLLGSIEQRKALLCGLMDTDGYVAKDGQCEFYSSKLTLIRAVSRLLHTFGVKHAMRTKKPPKDTAYAPSYRIKFVAPFPVFRLSTKAQRQNLELGEMQKWRYIVDVREVNSEPVKCIAVDSPDQLYLAGEECVPTHNTDLLLGLAMTAHRRSILFRSRFTDLVDVVTRGDEIQDGASTFVWGIKRRWDTLDNRRIEVGAIEHETDKFKYKGRPHDFIGIDEAVDFSESAYRFISGWLRTTMTGQRTRVVLTFNPPTTPEGEWVKTYFAPWLDDQHPNPAMPGELRWFALIEDRDTEVESGLPFDHKGVLITPKSRTFIPARLEDNPYLMQTDYAITLNNLPEPLRSQLRYGSFNATTKDHEWQVIPTEWVRLAQQRWQAMPKPTDLTLRSMGVDVARGGDDNTTIARLYGNWFAPLLAYPGKQTPDGQSVVKLVRQAYEGAAYIFIDVIGLGASPYDLLRGLDMKVYGVNFGKKSEGHTKSGKLRFANLRAECYWRFREALDPDNKQDVALPPDRRLLVDLCAARWKVEGDKIQIESKDDIRSRIGRSPDYGDAIVMAWWGANSKLGRPLLMT